MKRTHCYKSEKSKSQPIPQQTSSDQAPSATPVPPAIQAKSNEEGLAEWKAQQEKWARFGTPWMDKVPNPSGDLVQPWIQRKLTLGQPGDKYEQEADRVASQVVQQINAPSLSQFNQGQSVQQEKESEGEMQAKSLRAAIQRRQAMTDEEASADLESAINCARGSGQPLDAVLQQSMGQAMRADFSGVRVHTDAQSDQLNQSIQARAFTTGRDVFFREGAYQPGNRDGQELIAHELTHVMQQRLGKRAVKSGVSAFTYSEGNRVNRRLDSYDASKLHQSSSYGSTYKVKKRGIRNLKDISGFDYDDTEPSELLLYHEWGGSKTSTVYPAYTGDPSKHKNTPSGGFKRGSQGEKVACFWYGVRKANAEEPTWKSPSNKNAWVDFDHQPGVLSENKEGYIPDPSLKDGHFHIAGMEREADIPGLYEEKLDQATL
ncbi:eCIS core domain-containing protein [Acaryochloris marina NIES-2412]|uniref:eCIS core domain-containing protein n=1 Tax=Acaryochloris marina TaxID=155978 RepID=UPI0040582557